MNSLSNRRRKAYEQRRQIKSKHAFSVRTVYYAYASSSILAVCLLVLIVGVNANWFQPAPQPNLLPTESLTPIQVPTSLPAESSAPMQVPTPLPTPEVTLEPTPEVKVKTLEGNIATLSTGRKVDITQPIVALTFDDGPSKATTPLILEALETNDCTATFFMVGYQVEKPDSEMILKKMAEIGCEYANHTMNHRDLTTLDKDGQLEQVEDMVALVERYSGVRPKLVRPPYGKVDSSVYSNVHYPLVTWSLDTMDWSKKHMDPDRICAVVRKEVKDGSIILMHDIYETTAEAVVMLLPMLKEAGYQVVSASELFEAKDIELQPGVKYRSANP